MTLQGPYHDPLCDCVTPLVSDGDFMGHLCSQGHYSQCFYNALSIAHRLCNVKPREWRLPGLQGARVRVAAPRPELARTARRDRDGGGSTCSGAPEDRHRSCDSPGIPEPASPVAHPGWALPTPARKRFPPAVGGRLRCHSRHRGTCRLHLQPPRQDSLPSSERAEGAPGTVAATRGMATLLRLSPYPCVRVPFCPPAGEFCARVLSRESPHRDGKLCAELASALRPEPVSLSPSLGMRARRGALPVCPHTAIWRPRTRCGPLPAAGTRHPVRAAGQRPGRPGWAGSAGALSARGGGRPVAGLPTASLASQRQTSAGLGRGGTYRLCTGRGTSPAAAPRPPRFPTPSLPLRPSPNAPRDPRRVGAAAAAAAAALARGPRARRLWAWSRGAGVERGTSGDRRARLEGGVAADTRSARLGGVYAQLPDILEPGASSERRSRARRGAPKAAAPIRATCPVAEATVAGTGVVAAPPLSARAGPHGPRWGPRTANRSGARGQAPPLPGTSATSVPGERGADAGVGVRGSRAPAVPGWDTHFARHRVLGASGTPLLERLWATSRLVSVSELTSQFPEAQVGAGGGGGGGGGGL